MKHKLHETPKERLTRVISHCLAYQRQVSGASYLFALGLLIVVTAILVVAIAIGLGADNLVRTYVQTIQELAR